MSSKLGAESLDFFSRTLGCRLCHQCSFPVSLTNVTCMFWGEDAMRCRLVSIVNICLGYQDDIHHSGDNEEGIAKRLLNLNKK